jgi:chromosome segregation ATPase
MVFFSTGMSMAEEMTAGDALSKYEQERQRLAKLWDAYEKQEKDFAALKDRVTGIDSELADRDRIIKSLKDVLEGRDRRSRELEIEITSLRNEKTSYEPKIQQLTTDLRIERERFAKLFALAEELEDEIKMAKKAIEARDEWFRTHVDVFADIQRAVDDHQRMIASLDKVSDYGAAELVKLKK